MITQAKRVPDQMRAVVAPEPGSSDALRIVERPVPRPGDTDMLVRVEAIGVNRADVMQRRGFYPPPPGVTDVLGLEFAGKVAALGSDTSGWNPGDSVCGIVPGGSYAEYLTIPAALAMAWPQGLNSVEAAALPEALITTYDSLVLQADIQPGEWVLIHGGSSGIGTAAIQLAKAWGCQVVTTASSAEKLERCRALGATSLINYKTQDFSEVVSSATDGNGADVILDIVGGDYLEQNIRSLAVDGRMVVLGLIGGSKSELNMAQLLVKRLTIKGSTLRSRSDESKAALVRSVREEVWPIVEEGSIRPVVHEVMDIADVAAAHDLMESSRHVGKIVLTI